MRRIIAIFFALITVSVVCAQTTKPAPRKFDQAAYKAEQHKYILQRVKFTNEEASQFFALLDEMRAKERQLFDKNKRAKHKHPSTNEECEKAILDHDNTDLQRKKIQQLYHRRMLKVIPAKKLIQAIFAAEEFDHFKFREMFEGRHGNGMGKDGARPFKKEKGSGYPHPEGPRPHKGDMCPPPVPNDGAPKPELPPRD